MNNTADTSASRLETFTKPLCVRCAKEPALLTVPAANGSHDAVCALCAWTEVPGEVWRRLPAPGGKAMSSSFRLEGKHQIRDEKGRDIGGIARITRPDDHGYNDVERLGKWWLDVHATRNGKTFGASQRGTFYATLDEAKRAGVALLHAQQRRYAKKLGLGDWK